MKIKKIIIYCAALLFAIPIIVILLGIYKFNFTNDDIYVQTKSGEVVQFDLVSYETVTVGPKLVDCVGIAPQKCMIVNGEYFYGSIFGFDYEEGYTYTLEVEKFLLPKEDVAADQSSTQVNLIEIIEKVKSEG